MPYFPNSLWLLRIINTKYLVHVRADLTVDGDRIKLPTQIERNLHPGASNLGSRSGSLFQPELTFLYVVWSFTVAKSVMDGGGVHE